MTPSHPPVRRPRRARAAALALALVATVASAALAHDTWLLPTSLRVTVGQRVGLSLTSGMAFPADDFAIQPARVARADVRLAGTTLRLPRPTAGPRALGYRWVPRAPGVATIAVGLAPRALTLRGALIEEYLAEIDASPALRAEWSPPSPSTPWREVYTKHAKTFVRVDAGAGAAGPDAADTSWAEPSGLGLELVPMVDPTRLTAGDTLRLRVLYQGRPLADFPVGVEPEAAAAATAHGASHLTFARTDADGNAAVPLPAAGRWLLKGTRLRRVHEAAVDWRSDFTTLTLAVAPRR